MSIPAVKNWNVILYQNGAIVDRCIVRAPTKTLAKLEVIHGECQWFTGQGVYWEKAYCADRMTITVKRKMPNMCKR